MDGRNRYLACLIAGVKPHYKDYDGDDPFGFVLMKNASRRNMTKSQCAIIAARLSSERGKDDPQFCGLLTQAKAASVMGISLRTVEEAARLLREGTAELITEVEQGNVSINAALKDVKQQSKEVKASAKTVHETREPAEQVQKTVEKSQADEIEDVNLPVTEEGDTASAKEAHADRERFPCPSTPSSERLFTAFEDFVNDTSVLDQDRVPVFIELFKRVAHSFDDYRPRSKFLRLLCKEMGTYSMSKPLEWDDE